MFPTELWWESTANIFSCVLALILTVKDLTSWEKRMLPHLQSLYLNSTCVVYFQEQSLVCIYLYQLSCWLSVESQHLTKFSSRILMWQLKDKPKKYHSCLRGPGEHGKEFLWSSLHGVNQTQREISYGVSCYEHLFYQAATASQKIKIKERTSIFPSTWLTLYSWSISFPSTLCYNLLFSQHSLSSTVQHPTFCRTKQLQKRELWNHQL